ncbi:uncharacterized protein HD556DRAFT_1441626 [Suillus plorans]|uniref:Fungal-type protein kinase domain-containing protein n=1 Tax=Suillus plorans TaxID=116603 RepID=A0A9P7ATI2_9AGAM|nr:uncharacterized protein HD556DRAFT_1441626 [Suillus plorans]KAG1796319.1 hypothetical protein HD556DRAFT_1441626 [Suillus plorans]
MSIPVNDVPTLNRMTTIELDRLVTTEPQSLANGSLGHLLHLICKPFTANIPQAHTLRIKLSKILHRDTWINTIFSQNSPDNIVPLYDSQAGLWNWALPTTPPQSSANSNNTLPQPAVKKFTHEEIFSSFLNTLGTAMAESEDKLITLSATRTWSVSNSTVAVFGSNIKCKPDLMLSDDIKPKWGNIHYKPAQRIVKAADTQAYLLLSNQPWRRFALILSFTHQYHKLRVLLYDHAGGIVTPHIKIHQNPNAFAQIIAAVVFGSPECIGYDSMVAFWKNVPLPPPLGADMPGYRPFKNLPARATRSITFPAEPDSESLAALLEDLQELPLDNEAGSIHSSSDALEPILPADDTLELMSNDNLESLKDPIEEPLVLPPPPPVPFPTSYLPPQPLAVTSVPLLGLASQPLQGADTACSSTPHPSHFPHTPQSPAEPCGHIRGLVGRGTVCYLVSLDKEEYIIKDHWVQGGEEKVLNEINMLKAMSGVPGVPKLVDYWKVERSDDVVDQTWHYRHTENPSIRGTHCTHVHLIMKPCACPLHAFQMLKEFVRVIRDIVIVQCMAVDHDILHCDCSLYNAMIMEGLNNSRRLLIDWEFAVFITSNDKYSMVAQAQSLLCCARFLPNWHNCRLRQHNKKHGNPPPKLWCCHHLASLKALGMTLNPFFYVFAYFCIKYSGPNCKEPQESIADSLPDSWSNINLDVCKLRKVYFFAVSLEEACLANQFHPYFAKLIPLAKEWRAILKDNMEARCRDSHLSMSDIQPSYPFNSLPVSAHIRRTSHSRSRARALCTRLTRTSHTISRSSRARPYRPSIHPLSLLIYCVIDLPGRHITTLEDNEERSSTNENLKKSAAEFTKHLKKWQAEGGSMEPESVPQLAKWKKHEAADSGSASEVTWATMDSDGSDQIYAD